MLTCSIIFRQLIFWHEEQKEKKGKKTNNSFIAQEHKTKLFSLTLLMPYKYNADTVMFITGLRPLKMMEKMQKWLPLGSFGLFEHWTDTKMIYQPELKTADTGDTRCIDCSSWRSLYCIGWNMTPKIPKTPEIIPRKPIM